MLFVSVCLFFDFSRSLLIDSYIFSILFSRFLIIFTIIILNYFSGNLSIAPSFTWTSVFLVCSFICIVFLCLFIIIFFNLLCLRSPFPRPQGKLNSFFLLMSALLRLVMEKAMAPTPVLLPGKSHGWRSLVGCSPWGH